MRTVAALSTGVHLRAARGADAGASEVAGPGQFYENVRTNAPPRGPEDVLWPVNVSITEYDDHSEIRWKVGNLLADTSDPLDFWIVTGMNAPEELELHLAARSTTHRGIARDVSTVALSPVA